MKNNNIIIKDWAGNELFKGPYTSSEVDKVLSDNRCSCYYESDEHIFCQGCDDTGYEADFEVYWMDENRKDNVYEFINY